MKWSALQRLEPESRLPNLERVINLTFNSCPVLCFDLDHRWIECFLFISHEARSTFQHTVRLSRVHHVNFTILGSCSQYTWSQPIDRKQLSFQSRITHCQIPGSDFIEHSKKHEADLFTWWRRRLNESYYERNINNF